MRDKEPKEGTGAWGRETEQLGARGTRGMRGHLEGWQHTQQCTPQQGRRWQWGLEQWQPTQGLQ